MDVPAIDVRALSKLHGTDPALLDVSFEVPAGSLVTLSGASGSGKSTLLKLLAGCISPSGGRIRLHGADMRMTRLDATAAVGYVPQASPVCTSMRPVDILDFSGRARRLPRGTLDQRIRFVVDEWKLTGCLDVRCDELAPPLRTRVALALAVLHEPTILLLDEPLTGLPSDAGNELLDQIAGLAGRCTILMACAHGAPEPPPGVRRLVLDRGRMLVDRRPTTGPAR